MADLTFLMSSDLPGSPNPFYTLAKQYFAAAGSTVIDAPAAGQTLEGVFLALKAMQSAGTINLVSHASAFGAMICPVTLAAQAAGHISMSADDLEEALANKSLAPPGPAVITDDTRVVIYGCDVGRSRRFLTLLCGLFGGPGELLAPRRMGVFKSDATTVKYRQAQTWSVVRKAPLIPSGGLVPTGGWPAFRTAFLNDALNKFDRVAIAAEITGGDRLKAILTAAASNATTAFGPSFFMQEGIDTVFPATPTDADVAQSIKTRTNGDPVAAAAQSAAQVDDTTLVTTVSAADAYPVNAARTRYAITVIVLAQLIDADVLIAEGPNYQRVTSSKGRAPAIGPQPAGGGSGSTGGSAAGTPSAELQAIIDQFLASGTPQSDIDALLALIPQGEASEDSVADTRDTDDSWVGEAPDYLQLGEEDLA